MFNIRCVDERRRENFNCKIISIILLSDNLHVKLNIHMNLFVLKVADYQIRWDFIL